jgi:hypothetical protein
MQSPVYNRDHKTSNKNYLDEPTYMHIMERFIDISQLALVRNIFVYFDFAIEIV